MANINIREIEVDGFKVEVYNFGYASFYYPAFNSNAEFKVSSKGFKQLRRYLRTVKWLQSKVFLVLFLLPLFCTAQNQNWTFGRNVRLNPPAAFQFGAINTIEGASCLSNAAGQILAYSDGLTAYDRNNNAMPNGNFLTGSNSTTQSALIVDQPNTPNILYLFTLGQMGLAPLAYSVIDMTLNGGLGAVTAVKNVALNAAFNMRESVSAVTTCGGDTTWIVTKRFQSTNFYAYPLTAGGLGPAIISSAGLNGGANGSQGTLGFHLDGNRFAVCYYGVNQIETYGFNKSTGVVTFQNNYTINGVYDSKFAENLLYTFSNNGAVRQINVCTGTITQVGSTPQTVASLGTGWYADDGRIYISRGNNTDIARINNPLTPGVGCNFVFNAAIANGNTMFGLQNISMPYTRPAMLPFTYTSSCAQANLNAVPRTCFEPCTYRWIGSFGVANGLNVTVNLPNGNHSVTLERICDCETTSRVQIVNVSGGILAGIIGF